MHRLQELVRLHRMGLRVREVARQLGMGPNTERQYRQLLDDAGLLAGDVDDLPDLGALRAAVLEKRPKRRAPQESSSVERWSAEIGEMRARGAQPKAIFDVLKLEQPEFTGSLWAVKRFCRRLDAAREVQPQDVVIRVETAAGESAQVDFGYVGKLFDPERAVVRKAWVFVMVLGYSRHMFAKVVFDQRADTWQQLHVEAFEWFGGVPAVIVPDNLKAAVVRAAFGQGDSPALNRSYRELARHYGFQVDPAPARQPEKKGKVESGVKYVKSSFFRPRGLTDVRQVDELLPRWVMEIAGMRDHGTTHRKPLTVFETEEKPALMAMPATRYEPIVWKEATVHRDCQVTFERKTYPVPWRFVGRRVWLRVAPKSVTVLVDDVRIVTHDRRCPPAIPDEFLPPERHAWRHQSREWWEQKADALGTEVGAYVREVFEADDVLRMLRPVQAIVTHLAQFPPERAAAACARARIYGAYTFAAIRNILREGLDFEPLPNAAKPTYGAIAAPRYARTARELLNMPKEEAGELH